MKRRGFLAGILAAAAAPAIVRAGSLMKIDTRLAIPEFPWYTPAGVMRGQLVSLDGMVLVMSGDGPKWRPHGCVTDETILFQRHPRPVQTVCEVNGDGVTPLYTTLIHPEQFPDLKGNNENTTTDPSRIARRDLGHDVRSSHPEGFFHYDLEPASGHNRAGRSYDHCVLDTGPLDLGRRD